MSGNSAGTVMETHPPSNPLDVVPDEIPFGVPYGPSISLTVMHVDDGAHAGRW